VCVYAYARSPLINKVKKIEKKKKKINKINHLQFCFPPNIEYIDVFLNTICV
jgi:hypothetical protein